MKFGSFRKQSQSLSQYVEPAPGLLALNVTPHSESDQEPTALGLPSFF